MVVVSVRRYIVVARVCLRRGGPCWMVGYGGGRLCRSLLACRGRGHDPGIAGSSQATPRRPLFLDQGHCLPDLHPRRSLSTCSSPRLGSPPDTPPGLFKGYVCGCFYAVGFGTLSGPSTSPILVFITFKLAARAKCTVCGGSCGGWASEKGI